VPAAVFQKMYGSPEIMVQEVFGAGPAIDSRKDTRICSAIKDPVHGRKVSKILLVANVPHPDVDSEAEERLQIHLASLADQTIDTDNTNIRKMFKKLSGDDGSGKAANSGDKEVHGEKEGRG